MSYKSIDLQTSLPRTAEMTQLAGQQANKTIAEQAALAQHGLKEAERQARRMTKTESSAKGQIADRQNKDQDKQQTGQRKKSSGEEQTGEVISEHPFKGKHIDYTL